MVICLSFECFCFITQSVVYIKKFLLISDRLLEDCGRPLDPPLKFVQCAPKDASFL